MAHELGHVTNRDILVSTLAATMAGAVSMLGNMLQWAAFLGGGRGDEEEDEGERGGRPPELAELSHGVLSATPSRASSRGRGTGRVP